jgi:hypothetical protein
VTSHTGCRASIASPPRAAGPAQLPGASRRRACDVHAPTPAQSSTQVICARRATPNSFMSDASCAARPPRGTLRVQVCAATARGLRNRASTEQRRCVRTCNGPWQWRWLVVADGLARRRRRVPHAPAQRALARVRGMWLGWGWAGLGWAGCVGAGCRCAAAHPLASTNLLLRPRATCARRAPSAGGAGAQRQARARRTRRERLACAL